MNQADVDKMMEEGRIHSEFMAKVYAKQMQHGRFFLHEHPATATSWNEKCILKLLMQPEVQLVKADQCQYGLESKSDDGRMLPALKPTKFMTNAPEMAKLLQQRCKRDHEHQQLVSGRAAAAAFYQLKLIRTIIRGIRNTRLARKNGGDAVHAVIENVAKVTSKVTKLGGGHIDIQFDPRNFKEVYRDEYTNEILPTELIRAAIIEELDYFNSRVWEVTDAKNMKNFSDSKLVRCRWVLCNKGDAQQPDVRARLVACEVNFGGTREASFFASPPPLEAKRILFAKYAQEPVKNGVPQRISFVDVKKAYFQAIPKRHIFMSLPRELGLPGNWVAKQVRCVYGTRDAGALWEDTCRQALESIGFKSGVASPCIFFHEARDLACNPWRRLHDLRQ